MRYMRYKWNDYPSMDFINKIKIILLDKVPVSDGIKEVKCYRCNGNFDTNYEYIRCPYCNITVKVDYKSIVKYLEFKKEKSLVERIHEKTRSKNK